MLTKRLAISCLYDQMCAREYVLGEGAHGLSQIASEKLRNWPPESDIVSNECLCHNAPDFQTALAVGSPGRGCLSW